MKSRDSLFVQKYGAVIVFCLISMTNAMGQTEGNQTGTTSDVYVINSDASNNFGRLRLYTGGRYWTMSNEDGGSLTFKNDLTGMRFFISQHDQVIHTSSSTGRTGTFLINSSTSPATNWVFNAFGSNPQAVYGGSEISQGSLGISLDDGSITGDNLKGLLVKPNGLIGIGTSNPQTRLQVGRRLIANGGFAFDGDALSVIHQTPTSSSVLNDPKSTLMLIRQGTPGQAFGAGASFNLSRYENSGVDSRSRLDISMAHNSFDLTSNTVMSMLSSGNVGIGTTTPAYKLDVLGRGRIQSGNGTAGLWYTNSANTLDRAFVGMASDDYVGLWGNGNAGWGLSMNVNNGNVGIGTQTPGAKLEVAGQLKITGGTPGNGKVLTSDANGLASWQTPAGSSNIGALLDLGATISGREANAGKIGYQAFTTDALDIVGAGTSITNRKIKFWNEGGATFSGPIAINTSGEGILSDLRFKAFNNIGLIVRGNLASGTNNKPEVQFNVFQDTETQTMRLRSDAVNIYPKLDVGQNVSNSTSLLMDVHGHAIFNNDSDSLTSVSINTDARVGNAALTVGGPTYIGGWQGIESGAVNGNYLKKYNLWVQKGVVSEDFVFTPKTAWKDEVFQPGYQLPTLTEVENFIQENRHLPGVPSEQEVNKNGYSEHELNTVFLEKIEHLMLYSIAQEKKIADLEAQVKRVEKLEKEWQEFKMNQNK